MRLKEHGVSIFELMPGTPRVDRVALGSRNEFKRRNLTKAGTSDGSGNRALFEGATDIMVNRTDRDTGVQTLVVRDLRLPAFHPEEPVLFLPEGREVVHAFSDLVISGIAPPVPYVAPAKNGTYWYLGPVGLLIALGQTSRRLTAHVLPPETSLDELKVIAAKAALLRPIHWLAEARAWQILNQPSVKDTSTGFYRYAATKRRRVTELLRALETIEILHTPPPHLEHRVVSAVGPIVAALDPEFAASLLREAERHQWSVRQVIRLCQAWQSSAVKHWESRAARGLPRLTQSDEARLDAAGISPDELPTTRSSDIVLPYPLGSAGLVRLLIASSAPADELELAG